MFDFLFGKSTVVITKFDFEILYLVGLVTYEEYCLNLLRVSPETIIILKILKKQKECGVFEIILKINRILNDFDF